MDTSPLALNEVEDGRALLAALFESAPVAFQIYRADGYCLLVNQAFRDMFGTAPPPEYNLLTDDVLERLGFLDFARRAFSGETVHVPPFWYDARELRHLQVDDGRRVGIEVTLTPLRGKGTKVEHVALCFKDVTAQLELRSTTANLEAEIAERERAEAALRQTEEQLRQSQKMEAIGTLAGGIAHDFSNLLMVILSYVDLLAGDLCDADPMRADLDEIGLAAKRANDLTQQLLAFSRRQVLQPRNVNLNDSVAGMAGMLHRILGEDVELRVLPASDLGTVHVDPGQIEQVLMNLVVNARDAMPRGGGLTVETAEVSFDDATPSEPPGVGPGRYVMLRVSDTGAGMDRATQARIFEPFFTTKEKGKGTGLGLSTVYGIVTQSGGNISVDSEPGKGTTFKVYLPRKEGLADHSEREGPLQSTLDGCETVLLVEDDDQVRTLAATILRRRGYRVLDAASGEVALSISRQFQETIDLLLTDVVMPGMSGRQLWERLAPLRPGMKVLFMSGYTDDAIIRHGILSSEFAFLQKPLTPGVLLSKLREVLDAA